MNTPDEDDDWTTDLPVSTPTPRLKMMAHDLFDPIWKRGLAPRWTAYFLLAAKLGVPEPEAHFKRMPRKLLLRALEVIPEIVRELEARTADSWPHGRR